MGVDYSAINESIRDAGSEIASAMAPSGVGIVALIRSGGMLLATVFIIAYNAKTVNAALKQVEESQKSRWCTIGSIALGHAQKLDVISVHIRQLGSLRAF